MTDQTIDVSEPQPPNQDTAGRPPERMTRQQLVERGLDAVNRDRSQSIAVMRGGGLRFDNPVQMMDFAKMMAVGGTTVPKFLRGNAGACLAIVIQANEWEMSPFAVANKAYEVNDRVAYESQLLHAVIEARAPLSERLDCIYINEDAQRACIIIGKFTDGAIRKYESPPLHKIKGNSPLWVKDPDQQLFYYASRAWARRWCPDVLMGLYTPDELTDNPVLGREEGPKVLTMADRLKANGQNGDHPETEGFRAGHAEEELSNLTQVAGKVEILPPGDREGSPQARQTEPPPTEAPPETENAPTAPEKPTAEASEKVVPLKKGKAKEPKAEKPAKDTLTAENVTGKTYMEYMKRWLTTQTDPDEIEARWDGERDLRDRIGFPIKDRGPATNMVRERCKELRGE